MTAIVAKHNIIKGPFVGSFRFIPHFVNHHIILKLNILNLEDLAVPSRKKLLPISPLPNSSKAANEREGTKEGRKVDFGPGIVKLNCAKIERFFAD